jgi:HicB family
MPASVLYLRVSPALHDALKQHAADGGVSLNTFAVQALAAAAGPEFLRDVRAGGTPATPADEKRVLVRPNPEGMRRIVTEYVTYWVDRLGREHMSRVIANSKDHDRVWAWYVGRAAELAALAEISPRGAR